MGCAPLVSPKLHSGDQLCPDCKLSPVIGDMGGTRLTIPGLRGTPLRMTHTPDGLAEMPRGCPAHLGLSSPVLLSISFAGGRPVSPPEGCAHLLSPPSFIFHRCGAQ